MSANGRLLPPELTVVQQGALPIALATVAAKQWFGMKAAYDSSHADKLTVAAPIGGYRSYATQEDMHLRPWLYGLSAYSTIPIAPAGYSTHGDGMCVDVADASTDSPRKRWLLANASKFGFVRQFGDKDPNHYRLTSVPAGTGTEIPPTPIKKRNSDDMPTLYQTQTSGQPTVYALAGGSPGTPANWLETTGIDLANQWSAQIGGAAADLSAGTWSAFKTAYLAPLTVSGSAAPADNGPVLAAVAGVASQATGIASQVSAIPTTAASYNVQVTATPK